MTTLSLIWFWSKAAMRLAILAGGAAVYVLAVGVVLRLVPETTPQDAMKIAGAAVAVGAGGLAVSELVQRFRRRR
jgi:hypothetical protein